MQSAIGCAFCLRCRVGVASLGFVLRLPPSYGCGVSLCSSGGYSLKWGNMRYMCIDMTVFCEGISAMWKMLGVLNWDKCATSCSRWTVVQALRSFVALRMTYYVWDCHGLFQASQWRWRNYFELSVASFWSSRMRSRCFAAATKSSDFAASSIALRASSIRVSKVPCSAFAVGVAV